MYIYSLSLPERNLSSISRVCVSINDFTQIFDDHTTLEAHFVGVSVTFSAPDSYTYEMVYLNFCSLENETTQKADKHK